MYCCNTLRTLNKYNIKSLSKIFISIDTNVLSKNSIKLLNYNLPFLPPHLDTSRHSTSERSCSCCHLSDGAAVVRYDRSELAGSWRPRLCSRLEAGPARPAWQLRDSSRFVTRLRSTSRGWMSSSSVCPESSCVGGPLSRSTFLELCRDKYKYQLRTDGWTSVYDRTTEKTCLPSH